MVVNSSHDKNVLLFRIIIISWCVLCNKLKSMQIYNEIRYVIELYLSYRSIGYILIFVKV